MTATLPESVNSRRPSSRRAARVTDGGKGNSRDRARRRVWLVVTFGNGVVVQCWRCSTLLTCSTVTPDRFPVPGCEGGTYRRSNIRPCCLLCNVSDGGRLGRRKRVSAMDSVDITVFSRPGCVQCKYTMQKLDERGLAYVELDVEADPVARATVEEAAGGIPRTLPFVRAGSQSWWGFSPDRIKAVG